MRRVKLSAAARADLSEIQRYSIREFGLEVANAYLRGMNGAFALLAEHPFAGALETDLGDAIRCLRHKRHRIYYRVVKDEIAVMRIIHHARDVQSTTIATGER